MIPFPITPAEELVLPSEDLHAFQQLRAGLHAQYCAATPTELLLVEEVVQNTWRIRRFRVMETAALECPVTDIRGLALIQRALAGAERACHRALAALAKLRRTPVATAEPNPAPEQETSVKNGFVSQNLNPAVAAECGIGPVEFERLQAIRNKIHEAKPAREEGVSC